MDISLDLPQIMGRQRLDSNPFKYSATFFFTTMMDYSDEAAEEYMARIKNKKDKTEHVVSAFENSIDKDLKAITAQKYRTSQKAEQYRNDYISVVDDKQTNELKFVFNNYVMLNEIRAWEVQRSQYVNGTYVMGAIDNAFALSTPAIQSLVQQFLSSFGGTFENKMAMYAGFLEAHPECKAELQGCVTIPKAIKDYYNTFGYGRLKAMSWKEASIKQALSIGSSSTGDVKDVIHKTFTEDWYSLTEVKKMLQDIYDGYIPGKTAKATDLKSYFECKESKRMSPDTNKRENGYSLLATKDT